MNDSLPLREALYKFGNKLATAATEENVDGFDQFQYLCQTTTVTNYRKIDEQINVTVQNNNLGESYNREI